jgi:hypothetical protein
MSNDFYNISGAPATGSPGSSATMRAEFSAIAQAFDKLPNLIGQQNKLILVNSLATGLTTGPVLPAGDIVGTTETQTLTNKTFVAPALGVPISGSLTNCIDLPINNGTTGTLNVNRGGTGATSLIGVVIGNGTSAFTVKTNPASAFVGVDDTQTLTNKTISGSSNTLSNIANSSLTNSFITINGSSISLGASGTITATATQALTIGTGLSGTSYNGSSAVTIAIDSTVATLTGTQTLTNKSLTSPNLTGTPIAPTAVAGTNTTQIATTAFTGTAITNERTATATLTNKTINFSNNTLTGVAPLASPALSGIPTAPTAAAGTNTTQIATTAHVFAERANTATLTNKTISGTNNTITNIGNASLTNSAITFGATSQALGSTVSALNAVSIGQTTRAAGSFTTLDANGNVILGDATADTISANGRFNTDVVPSTDNARDLGTSALKWKQVYATTFTENGFPIVTQTDIGTAPNEIPLNQFLGNLAFMNSNQLVINPTATAVPSGIGDMVFELASDTSLVVKVRGSDGTVRSVALTLA